MNRGDNEYNNLKEVIFLAIANFSLFPDKLAYKSDHVMLDNQTYENDLKSFSFTFLELAKFHKEKHELKTMIEKWAYFFKHAEETAEDEINEIFKDDLVIKQAYEELNRFNWTEDELLAYDQEIKRILDNKAILDFQLDKAKQLELEEGMEKGRAEEKTRIARKLLQQGFNFTEIKNIIDLSPEEMESLQE